MTADTLALAVPVFLAAATGAWGQDAANQAQATRGRRPRARRRPAYRCDGRFRAEQDMVTPARLIIGRVLTNDQLATGRALRVLTFVDTWSHYSPAVDPRFSYRGEDVVRTLEAVCQDVSSPKAIRVDQGLEFVSRHLDLLACQHGVTLDFSRPGKPTDNAFIESSCMVNGSEAASPP